MKLIQRPWAFSTAIILGAILASGLSIGCNRASDAASATVPSGKSGAPQTIQGSKAQFDGFNGAQTPDQVPAKYRDLARQMTERQQKHQSVADLLPSGSAKK